MFPLLVLTFARTMSLYGEGLLREAVFPGERTLWGYVVGDIKLSASYCENSGLLLPASLLWNRHVFFHLFPINPALVAA